MAASSLLLPLLLLLMAAAPSTTHAQVPAKSTFKYVNEGEFGPYITEYDASYRTNIDLFAAPFQLMWYNATPGQYYLGLRMGLRRSESLFRWVWDANRGRPVGERATLTFSRDGNLVLAEADGRVVWSTGTANKGVVGIKILPVGNIVLYDRQGRFLWQSFDHPTDTLFVGQSLRVGGPTRLVSRRSATDNSDGIYSFVLEPKGLNLYVASSSSSQKPFLYSSDRLSSSGGTLTNVTFRAEPDLGTATELQLSTNDQVTYILARPKYNATQTILRLQADGNLVAYTYYEPVDYRAWERTYTFFSSDGDLTECDLPSKCGSLGLCEDQMCVGCPTAKGTTGWNKSCAPPAPAPCKAGGGKPVDYFKVTGVEAFLPKFNKETAVVAAAECKRRCGLDCSCFGFFYWEESSRCWLASSLGTLSKVSNSSHLAYIKYSI